MKHDDDMREDQEDQEELDEAWFDRLDALIAGEELPASTDDDELLQMAARLKDLFAPLRTLHNDKDGKLIELFGESKNFEDDLPGRFVLPEKPVRLKRSFSQKLLAIVAAAVFLVLGVRMLFPPLLAQMAHQGQQFGSILRFQGDDTSAVSGDDSDPTLTGNFAIKYGGSHHYWYNCHLAMYGYNAFLYVEPHSRSLVSASKGLQVVKLGTIKGFLDHDSDGKSVVIWPQRGMDYYLFSKLPSRELVNLALILQEPKPVIPLSRTA